MRSDLLNSLSATGLLIDILGALLIALVVLNTASKSILRNSAAHMGYNYDHSISQITQRNDTILGICLIIVGFSLQFLEALGYVANFFSKTISCLLYFYFPISLAFINLIYKDTAISNSHIFGDLEVLISAN